MKPTDRNYTFYLGDILMSIEKIEQYTSKIIDFQELEENGLIFDVVIRNLEIIGEATKNILEHIKVQNHDIPWNDMYRTKNVVSHHYFGIDSSIIWQIIKYHLPNNKLQISNLLKTLTQK